MRTPITLATLALTMILAAGCENEGPAERAGEAIDDAAENVSDAGRDFGNAVEDACEDIKEGAGAEDKNC